MEPATAETISATGKECSSILPPENLKTATFEKQVKDCANE